MIGTGKRKTSVARVFLKPKEKIFTVNGMDVKEYFKRESLLKEIYAPLVVTDKLEKVGIKATVEGGGVSGQAGALRHGITMALLEANPELRSLLKPEGLITRDDRQKERKKPGFKKARKRPQFSKR